MIFFKDENYVRVSHSQTHSMDTQALRSTALWSNSHGELCLFYLPLRNLPCILKALRIPASTKAVCLTLFNPVLSKLFCQSPCVTPVGRKCSGEAAFQDGITSLYPWSTPDIAFAGD